MELEPRSVDPLIERRCGHCGGPLSEEELKAALDAGSPPVCLHHAAEEVPIDEDEAAYPPEA